MITTELVHDATHENIGNLPSGLAAGYVTGSATVQWTATDFADHPHAIRIDQTPAASVWDATADADDFENGAVTLAELAPRAKARMASFAAGARPGQRRPVVYASRVNITEVVNALIGGGVTSGVGLWVADWNNDQAGATAEVENGSGPFPIIGRQFENNGSFDTSVFSQQWIDDVSVAPVSTGKPQVPPGQWNNPLAWSWKQVIEIGLGLNGEVFAFAFNPTTGEWVKVMVP